jgi:hypothetical protein
MGAETLGGRIAQSPARARELLQLHREAYPVFWRWSDSAVDHAMLRGFLWTTFGWTVYTGPDTNPRSLRNFPMQANGAEMLRLACCFATERGVRVCAPVHDAVLIEAAIEDLEGAVLKMQRAMIEASQLVLAGFALRSEANIVCYPDRFQDARGQKMWETVLRVLGVTKDHDREHSGAPCSLTC